jgi:hypothetical protein
MQLPEIAELRMMEGRASHPEQEWDKLPGAYLYQEAIEELADCWNYVERMENCDEIREALLEVFDLIKENEYA